MTTTNIKRIKCNAKYETFNSWRRLEKVPVPLCIKVLEIDWQITVGEFDYCLVGYVSSDKEKDFNVNLEFFKSNADDDIEVASQIWSLLKNDWFRSLYGKALFRKNIKTGVVQNYVDLFFDDGDCSYPVKRDIDQFVCDIKGTQRQTGLAKESNCEEPKDTPKADMALEKAKEQVKKFKDYCDATKSELDSKYYTLTHAEQRKLIDRLYEIQMPNVKFKIGEKVIPLFAMTEKRFIGKENGEYLLVEYEYIEDHGEIVYDGMLCTGLSGDGCPTNAEYVFDENDDLQNKKFLEPPEEIPF